MNTKYMTTKEVKAYENRFNNQLAANRDLIARAERFEFKKYRSGVGELKSGKGFAVLADDSGIVIGPTFAKVEDAQQYADDYDVVSAILYQLGGTELTIRLYHLMSAKSAL